MAKRVSKEVKEFISRKIRFLVEKEGLKRDHAVGKAFGIARQRFGSRVVPKVRKVM